MDDDTKELIPIRSVRRYPAAITAVGFTVVCVLLSLTTNSLTVKMLFYIGGLAFLLAAVDLFQKKTFKIKDNHLLFREAFIWKKWRWEDLTQIEAIEQTWLGIRTHKIRFHHKQSGIVEIEETRTTVSQTRSKYYSAQSAAERLESIRKEKEAYHVI